MTGVDACMVNGRAVSCAYTRSVEIAIFVFHRMKNCQKKILAHRAPPPVRKAGSRVVRTAA